MRENNQTGIGEFEKERKTTHRDTSFFFWQRADILVLVFTARFQGPFFALSLSLGSSAVKKKIE